MNLKKKFERYLRVNLLGLGPRLMKKEFTGPRSDKGWETQSYAVSCLQNCITDSHCIEDSYRYLGYEFDLKMEVKYTSEMGGRRTPTWPRRVSISALYYLSNLNCKGKGKSVPLQAWTGPEVSRKLRFPDFVTTAHDGGKVVSLTHRPPLPPGNTPGTHFC